jgi:hypothetical protein
MGLPLMTTRRWMIVAAVIALAFGSAVWMLGERAAEKDILSLAVIILVSPGLPYVASVLQFPEPETRRRSRSGPRRS